MITHSNKEENATFLACGSGSLPKPQPCVHTGTYHRRDVCVLIKYHTVLVPFGRTGGEVYQCGASDPQIPAHSPHCCSEWAGQSNGDDSCSGTINQLKENLYSRIQNFKLIL